MTFAKDVNEIYGYVKKLQKVDVQECHRRVGDKLDVAKWQRSM